MGKKRILSIPISTPNPTPAGAGIWLRAKFHFACAAHAPYSEVATLPLSETPIRVTPYFCGLTRKYVVVLRTYRQLASHSRWESATEHYLLLDHKYALPPEHART